jgi:hypothetical protein
MTVMTFIPLLLYPALNALFTWIILDGLLQPPGNGTCFGCICESQNDELVSSPPDQHVIVPDGLPCQAGNTGNDFVPCQVPQGISELLTPKGAELLGLSGICQPRLF